MIAIDLDGTVVNYDARTATLFNMDLLRLLPRQHQPVALCTNQAGIPFSYSNNRFPTALAVAVRIQYAMDWMQRVGYPIVAIRACTYHPKAAPDAVERAARELRSFLAALCPDWHVYATERARKPSPLMLQSVAATCYYGDSPEDEMAANAAGIPFIRVERFQ